MGRKSNGALTSDTTNLGDTVSLFNTVLARKIYMCAQKVFVDVNLSYLCIVM